MVTSLREQPTAESLLIVERAQKPEVVEVSNVMLDIEHGGDSVKISAKERIAGRDLIIFLHGLGCRKESFDGAFTAPSLNKYSIFSFDFPGHGDSGKGLPTDFYTLATYAEITRKVISDLLLRESGKFNRVIIAGHSMGGAVGVLSAQSVDEISVLVSIDGNLVGEDCGLVSRQIADQDDQEFVAHGFPEFVRELRKSDRPGFMAWAKWIADVEEIALRRAADSLVSWSDSEKLLDKFNQFSNAAYIYGELDDRGYLRKKFSHRIDVAPVPKSSHFMMVDNPIKFYEVLAKVLANV